MVVIRWACSAPARRIGNGGPDASHSAAVRVHRSPRPGLDLQVPGLRTSLPLRGRRRVAVALYRRRQQYRPAGPDVLLLHRLPAALGAPHDDGAHALASDSVFVLPRLKKSSLMLWRTARRWYIGPRMMMMMIVTLNSTGDRLASAVGSWCPGMPLAAVAPSRANHSG